MQIASYLESWVNGATSKNVNEGPSYRIKLEDRRLRHSPITQQYRALHHQSNRQLPAARCTRVLGRSSWTFLAETDCQGRWASDYLVMTLVWAAKAQACQPSLFAFLIALRAHCLLDTVAPPCLVPHPIRTARVGSDSVSMHFLPLAGYPELATFRKMQECLCFQQSHRLMSA